MLSPIITQRCALLFGPIALTIIGCGPGSQAPPSPPPPTVTVSKAVLHEVQSYHQYNGYLDSVESVEIRARVKGILEEVLFEEGQDIEANKALYTIDPREYKAAVLRAKADIEKAIAETASAEAQLKSAEAELARLKKIGSSVSASEMDQAVANVGVRSAQKMIALAARQSAEAALRTAELNEEFTHIKAPIAGRISRTLVTKGNLVGQNETTLLTTIVRMDKLFIYFDAPERDLVEQLNSTPAERFSTIPVEIAVATEEGFPHKGVIDFRENRVDPGTGTIRVRGLLDNPVSQEGQQRLLYPGLFARVRIPAGPKRKLLVIPEDAILSGQQGKYVYVLDERNIVKPRNIKVLDGPPIWRRSEDDQAAKPDWTITNPEGKLATPPSGIRSVVAIESGLNESDTIIVAGLQKARPEAPVTPEVWTFRGPTPNN